MRDAQSFGQQIARGQNTKRVLRGTVFEAGNGTAGVELADGVRLRRVATSGTLTVGDVVDVELSGSSARILTAGEVTSGSSLTAIAGAGGGALTGAPSPHDLLGVHHTLPTLSANLFLASLLSGSGQPSFRAIGALDLPGQFSGFGNPTAQIGLTAINGTATTAMRSDAAPALNVGITPTWTGAHIFSATVDINNLLTVTKTTEQLRLRYDVSNYASLTVGSGGNLTVAPTGDVLFDPAGNDILPVTNYDLNLGSLTKKYLTLHAAELWVETLVAQDTIATIGGRVLVTPTTTLTRDLSNTASSESTITQRGSATSANGSSSAAGTVYVNTAQTYAPNTDSITVNVPSGTLENHLMIAAIHYWGTLSLTAPGGWTLLQTQEIHAGGGELGIYYKVASGSEPANYTWSLSETDYSIGVITTYSGVDTAAPIDVSAIEANTSSTSATQTAITTTAANAMLLYFATVDDGPDSPTSGFSATPPSGMTERTDFANGWKYAYMAEVLQAGAGTTGTKTATLSSARASVTALVALKPASSTTQTAVTKPTGTTTGDLLLFAAAVGSTTAVLTTPTGLTQIATASNTGGRVVWYYKIATSSEGSSYTFALNTTDNLSVSCVAWYNVDTSSPIEAYTAVSVPSSTSMTATGVSPTSTTARLIFSGAAIDTSAGSITATAPSGMTELIDAGSGTVRIYMAHQALSAAGLTGNKTAALSSAKASLIGLFAIKPVTTGGSNTIYVKHNQMQAGDIAYMQANGKVEFMAIASAPTTVTAGAEYSYTVTRNLDGTGANTWNAGDALANTGTIDSGFIDLYSLESIKGSPFDYIYNYNTTGAVYSSNLAQESSWALWDSTAGNIGANDAIYYGVSSAPFSAVYHYIQTTEAASGNNGTVEYWNGSAWTAVIGLVIGGNASFATAGITSLSWPIASQTNWAATTVNGVSAYWVRFRITAGTWTRSPVQGQRRVYRDKNTWGPTIAGMVRTSTTFNDIRERWAIGNLNGLYDYGLNTYGAAFGDPTKSWLGVDATNGVRIMNASTTLAKWDIGGNLSVGNTSGNHIYTAASGNLEVKRAGTTLANFGADVGGFSGAVAAFYDDTAFLTQAFWNDGSASKTTVADNTGVLLREWYRTSGAPGIQYSPVGGAFKLNFIDELGEFYLGRIYHDVNYYTSAVDAATIIDATPEKSTLKAIGTSAVTLNTKLVLKADTTDATGTLNASVLTATRAGNTLTSASLNTGWNNFGSGFQDARYKIFGDFVHITGLVYRASGSNTTIFTLPSGYRPALRRIFTVSSNNAWARVDVKTDGAVEYQSGGDVTVWICLDGITFSTL